MACLTTDVNLIDETAHNVPRFGDDARLNVQTPPRALALPYLAPTMIDSDPLYRLRHALLGIALALIISVPLAAWLGTLLTGLFVDSYGWRVAIYAALLAYVIAGAGLLFVKVARHETRALSFARLATWLASLWCWPLLLLRPRPAA